MPVSPSHLLDMNKYIFDRKKCLESKKGIIGFLFGNKIYSDSYFLKKKHLQLQC